MSFLIACLLAVPFGSIQDQSVPSTVPFAEPQETPSQPEKLSARLPVIPLPNKISYQDGFFEPQAGFAIRFEQDMEPFANGLAKQLQEVLGYPIKTARKELRIIYPQELHISNQADTPKEGYRLQVTEKRIDLTAGDSSGFQYGGQTLLQALQAGEQARLPLCDIQDEPRFGWRGMHLDVGRHFFAVEEIKKFLVQMAAHKFNVFHWHLTEDQGWRIEIKAYPKLHEVGAFRASSPPYGERLGSDGQRYGGYYTQEEVREVVAFAADLNIVVVPEIDMPGHMSAAIAAYPALGNQDIPDYDPIVQTKWGVHLYTLSPTEETFVWVEAVLNEVCDLFPSQYIHVGGDEAPINQWQASATAQAVMQREGLKDESALQAYFLSRVNKMLLARDRKMLGWDEIRMGGLAKGATVMVWRAWHHAAEAVAEGHDVVMAPTSHTYFDYYQAEPPQELAKGVEFECIGGRLPLQKVYDFEPVPKELLGKPEAKHILGAQGQIWTEYVKTWDKAEYLTFPRAAALAEVVWTQPEHKNWKDFQVRLRPMLERYKKAGVRYFDPFAE